MAHSRVNRSHIVPRGHLKNFSDHDMIEMHLVGDSGSKVIPTRHAGVKKRYYRRKRPDGTTIDDIEWSLGQVEADSLPTLAKIDQLWPLPPQTKARIGALFGCQLVRGSEWRDWHASFTREFIDEQRRSGRVRIETEDEVSADEVLQAIEAHLLDRTPMLTRMLDLAAKVGSVLASMQWILVEFRSRLVAISNHPVTPWPLSAGSRRPDAMSFADGLMNTLEVRVPVSPTALLLLTWADEEDARVKGRRDHAANANAFTVAQAREQWFHYSGKTPPIASGLLLPLAPQLKPHYTAKTVASSQRRPKVAEAIQKLGELTGDMTVITVSDSVGT